MAFFTTFDDLRRFNRKIDESALLKAASTSISGKTIFLSHSSKDNEYLPAVISVLENNGGSVYIDNEDDRLPNSPNRETAKILSNTIRHCRRFVLFVTTNSKDSKWIPWELGLADGEKGDWAIALFPAAEKNYDQNWSTIEYLGLYQRIVWGKIQGDSNNGWIVLNHEKNTAEHLKKWLTGG